MNRPALAVSIAALIGLGGVGGYWLASRHAGSFTNAVAAAGGSADRLARSLAEMPLYRDVARYADFDVPLYKRAQITSSNLATAFGGRGPGAFRDLDQLTIFADNLVPHVLRREGVLAYDTDLAGRIERGELIPPGSVNEIEIRACAVHACVQIAERLGVPERTLDTWLWDRGQEPRYKALPRHRTRTVYY